MSEEVDRRLSAHPSKESITEIYARSDDSIEELRITYKSGRVMVIK